MYPGMDELRDRVNRSLAGAIPSGDDHQARVIEAMRYATLAPGKRIRPVAFLEMVRLAGEDVSRVMPSACAIEFIHTSSLILDDLPCMDNATIRRGQPAVHHAFNEYTAILASIALLMEAFGMIARNAREMNIPGDSLAELLEDLTRRIGAQGMIAGQYYQLAAGNQSLGQDDIEYINRHKTSELFEIAARLALCLTQAPETLGNRLMRFSYHIGQAFQILDDVSDVNGDGSKMGKNTGQDSERATAINGLGLNGSEREARDQIRRAVDVVTPLPRAQPLILLAKHIHAQF